MIDYRKVKKIYFYTKELDMRNGMRRIQTLLGFNFSSFELMYTLFVFCAKDKRQVKIYYEDEYGSWLMINKLNEMKYKWPEQVSGGGYAVEDMKLLLKGLKVMSERKKEISYLKITIYINIYGKSII